MSNKEEFEKFISNLSVEQAKRIRQLSGDVTLITAIYDIDENIKENFLNKFDGDLIIDIDSAYESEQGRSDVFFYVNEKGF